MSVNSNLQKPIVYLRPAPHGRVTKWLCGGLQIRIRGFKSLPALFLILIFLFIINLEECSADVIINEIMYDPLLNDNFYVNMKKLEKKNEYSINTS